MKTPKRLGLYGLGGVSSYFLIVRRSRTIAMLLQKCRLGYSIGLLAPSIIGSNSGKAKFAGQNKELNLTPLCSKYPMALMDGSATVFYGLANTAALRGTRSEKITAFDPLL